MSVFVSFLNQNICFFPSKCIVKYLEGLCDRIIIILSLLVVLKLVGDVYYKHVFGFASLERLCLSMLTG